MKATFVLLAAVISAVSSAYVPLHHLVAAGLEHPSWAGAILSDAAAPSAIVDLNPTITGASGVPAAAGLPASPALTTGKLADPYITASYAPAGRIATAYPSIFTVSPAGASGASPLARFAIPATAHATSVFDSFSAPAVSPFSTASSAGVTGAASLFRSAAPYGAIDAYGAHAASPLIYAAPHFARTYSPSASIDIAGPPSVILYAPGSTISFAPTSAPGALARYVDLAAVDTAGVARATHWNPSTPAGSAAAPGAVYLYRSPVAAFAAPADVAFGSANAPIANPATPAVGFIASAPAPAGIAEIPASVTSAAARGAPHVVSESPVGVAPSGAAASPPAPTVSSVDPSAAQVAASGAPAIDAIHASAPASSVSAPSPIF